MKKKVAILTLPLHHNFGGNLQVYALANVLEELGYNVEVINIQSKSHKFLLLSYNYIKQIIKIIFKKGRINFILLDSDKEKLYKNHRIFLEKNINLTKKITHKYSLEKIISEESYHAIIVGSDQVWRKEYTPNIYKYFLDFVKDKKIRKIAYAASFGVSKWQYDKETTQRIKELAKDFHYISVRELDAVDLCREYLDVVSENVLDPTLLLSKQKYLSLIEKIEIESKNKLFTYILDKNSYKETFIKKICKENNFELHSIDLFKVKEKPILCNIDNLVTPSIESWLSNFRDAEFILTDSFHGMVFSIIFNKEFLVFVNEDRGASRFYSLLKFLQLEDRVITESSFNLSKLEKIDYDKINSLIDKRVYQIKNTLARVIK